MPTEKKAEAIDQLTVQLRGAKTIILTDYRGLPTQELKNLRGKLKSAKGEYHIVKNTLVSIAAKRIGISGLDSILEGPTAMAISTETESELAKSLIDHIRISRSGMAVKGGVLGTMALDEAQVRTLATLPSKLELQAKLAGTIQGPMASLVGVFNGALSELVRVFDARVEQENPASGQSA